MSTTGTLAQHLASTLGLKNSPNLYWNQSSWFYTNKHSTAAKAKSAKTVYLLPIPVHLRDAPPTINSLSMMPVHTTKCGGAKSIKP